MAVIFMEGFEHPYWAVDEQINGWRDTGSATVVSQVDDVEHGKRARIGTTWTSGTSYTANCVRRFYRTVGADWGDYLAIGFRVKVSANNATLANIHRINENGSVGTTIIEFGTNASGMCMINGATVPSGLLMEPNVDHYLELELDKLSMSGRVWLNNQFIGVVQITEAFDSVGYWIGFVGSRTISQGSYMLAELDDHYVVDGIGSVNRSRLGRVKVVMRLPEDDQVAEFERVSGDSNASQVGDLGDPTADGTYVYSNIEGAVDLYTNSETLPFDEAPVLAIGVTVIGRKEGPDARSLAPLVRSGMVDEVGDRVNLYVTEVAGGMSVFNIDPSTLEPWTRENAEAASFGHTLVV